MQGSPQIRVDAMSGQPVGVLICKGHSVFRCMRGGKRPCSAPRVVASTLPQRLDRLVVRDDERGHDGVGRSASMGRSRTDRGSARKSR